MIELEEPLAAYMSYLRDEHKRNVSEYFEGLVDKSGVDEQLNIKTINELQELENGVSKASSKKAWLSYARGFTLIFIGVAVYEGFIGSSIHRLWFIPALLLVALLILKLNPVIKNMNLALTDLKVAKDGKVNEALAQMEALNDLFSWETSALLFQKTLPDIKLDKYFAHKKLVDLLQTYNLSSQFTDGRSILSSQSGSYKNNPFVISKYIHHGIGTRTYTGAITIYWTETVRDANGNYQTIQKSQVLTASVVKPFPEYNIQTTVIYGHEAAPNLSFSREPSNLSGLDDGLMNNWRKNRTFKKVERKARKDIKTGRGQLTVVSNKEFETLFNAIDRDHEVEFRLLFTPLAQQEMVNLLKDKEVGYGDNFGFAKDRNINFIETGHLGNVEFQPNPLIFNTLSVSHARSFFNDFNNEFFRSLYFGLAPLFTIPPYAEERSVPFPKIKEEHEISYWEHEAMANYIGQEVFRHPNSVTQNLLKTSNISTDGPLHTVSVTAYGYEGYPRVDYVAVAGGDGNIHSVPVEWIEYIGVAQESRMIVSATSGHEVDSDESTNMELMKKWDEHAESNGIDEIGSYRRGYLVASLL